jgi:hypothetical protein
MQEKDQTVNQIFPNNVEGTTSLNVYSRCKKQKELLQNHQSLGSHLLLYHYAAVVSA